MSLWKSTDANTSAPLYALAQLNVTANQSNMNIAYGNVTTGAYFTGAKDRKSTRLNSSHT